MGMHNLDILLESENQQFVLLHGNLDIKVTLEVLFSVTTMLCGDNSLSLTKNFHTDVSCT